MTRRVKRRKTVKRKQKGGSFKDAIKMLAPYGPLIAKKAVKKLTTKKKVKRRRRRRQVYE
jgi:hypothetical protein